jgi:hypothetical protein
MTGAKRKTKSEAVQPIEKESTRIRPGLEKHGLPGPWTEADERWFQFMMREFGGGHAERDPDL